MNNKIRSVNHMLFAQRISDHKVVVPREKSSTYVIGQFVVTCLVGYILLVGLTLLPRFSIFLVDLLFCFFFYSIFRSNLRYIFLFHPFILLLSNQLFTVPFLELGDGLAYQSVIDQYIDFNTKAIDFTLVTELGAIDAFKYMSIGVVPVYLIPEYLYNIPESDIYYLWQGTFHVILIAGCVALAKTWNIIRNDYLLFVALFAVVSPSFFELGTTPTRHIVTFTAVFLSYISIIAVFQKITVSRLAVLFIAVLLVLISKVT